MKPLFKRINIYFYMFLLLAVSGNPFFSIENTKGKILFIVLVILLGLRHHSFFNPKKGIIYYQFLLFFVVLFIFQRLTLGYLSVESAMAFLCKITLGYIIIRYLGKNFKYAFLQVIFVISLISLVGYAWNVLGNDIAFLYFTPATGEYNFDEGRNLILFHQNGDGLRNSGMFWEPGVFGCYICLLFALYLGNIRNLVRTNKWKILIILIAFITTFSTTAYIVLFFIGLATIYIEYSRKYGPLVLLFLSGFALFAYLTYEKNDFLKDKIQNQIEVAFNRDVGEFAPDRISAFLFDIYYIKKHPLVGNAYHESTRFADHASLHEEVLGHGNGFSDFVASMGVLSLLFYSFYILKYNKNYPILFLAIIFILLQGEPLLNYTFFLSLPFVFLYAEQAFIKVRLKRNVLSGYKQIVYP